MCIMSAGMHTPFMSGYVIDLIGLLNRKGVHIRTERDCLSLFSSPDGRNEAAVSLIFHKRNPQLI